VTSYTVTGTATNNTFTGGLLKVYVLDNAVLAGTPATGSSTTAFNCSVTTTQAGSFVCGTSLNLDASTAFSASAGTTITDDGSVNTGGSEGCAFHTTSGTGSPGPTTVGSSTTFPGSYGCCALEILASGGTLTFDASSPAAVISTTLTSFTTASFTPPGGSLLVAVLDACGNGAASVPVGTVSSTPTLAGWTEQVHLSSTVGGFNGYVGVWTASVPAGGGIPVLPPSWTQRVAVVPFTADVIM
jgi:hypothetical protein